MSERYLRFSSLAFVALFALSACDSNPSSSSESSNSDTDNTDSPVAESPETGTPGAEASGVEQFGDEYWATLAQEYEPFVPDNEPGLGFATPAEARANGGEWEGVVDWPLIPVGAAGLADGRVLGWAFGNATIYNPIDNSFTPASNNSHNMFCAGVSMLPDGRFFAAGGGSANNKTSIFSNEDAEWTEEPTMTHGRFYPTSTTLRNGQVFTALGTTASAVPELWTEGAGWELVPSLSMTSTLEQPATAGGPPDWFPALHVAPDGTLFHPGPTNEMLTLDVFGDAGLINHGAREAGDSHRVYGANVMYDIGKMLMAGGGKPAADSALTIDINGATPVVTTTNKPKYARSFQNTVVLPDGQVLMIGGNTDGVQFSDNTTILTPELWNPQTGEWAEMSNHQIPRNYHSTALLLQDARVLAMGGGLCGGCPTNHPDSEIFSPPYLFDDAGDPAARPEITQAPATAHVAQVMSVIGTDDLADFSMVRLTALTHHTNTDRRFIPLVHQKTGTGLYAVELPDNPNVLLPGEYWLFGLNADGVPSVGHGVRILVGGGELSAALPDQSLPVSYEYFEGTWNQLPDFDTLTPVATGQFVDISLSPRTSDDFYGFRYRTLLEVPAAGNYTFHLGSDDGSALSINGQRVISNDGTHSYKEKTHTQSMQVGVYEIEVLFFEKAGSDTLKVEWEGPNLARQSLTSQLVTSQQSGLPVTYEYYEGTWNQLPDFDTLTPIATGQQLGFSLNSRESDDFYAFRFRTLLEVPAAGSYTFYLGSDDGSVLSINGQTVIDNDGLHSFKEKTHTRTMQAGIYDIEVLFFEKGGFDTLKVEWEGPNLGRQDLATNVVPLTQANSPVTYEYYEGTWNQLPDFDALIPVATGQYPTISLNPRQSDDFYGFRYTSQLEVPATGSYTFYLGSDDGSALYIDGQLVIINDGLHSYKEKTHTRAMQAGVYDIRVEFFEKGGYDTLNVEWEGPGLTRQDLSAHLVQYQQSGLPVTYEYFEGNWNQLPNFDNLTPVATGQDLSVSLEPRLTNDFYGFRYRALLEVAEEGAYTFYLGSDDGSELWINGQRVINNDGLHGFREKTHTLNMRPGIHDIEVQFFEKGGSDKLSIEWAGPNVTRQDITAQLVWITQTGSPVSYEYYEGNWNQLPDFDTLTPVATGQYPSISLNPRQSDKHYGFRYRMLLEVPVTGAYTFYVTSDDGSALSINGQRVIDNDGTHPPREKTHTRTMQAGVYSIGVEFFERLGGDMLRVEWAGPGMNRRDLTSQLVSTGNAPVIVAKFIPEPQLQGDALALTAVAQGQNLQYKWNFGDGSAETAYTSSPSISHTYNSAGRYLVSATVRDGDGNVELETFTQIVHAPVAGAQAKSSTSILEHSNSVHLWNVNPDNNSVSVVSTQTFDLLAEIPVGHDPASLAEAPNGDIWVVNRGDASISIVSAVSFAVTDTISLKASSQPYGLVFSSANAFVALEAVGKIAKLSLAGAPVSEVAVGTSPRHLAIDGAEQTLYVSRFITPPLPGEDTASPVVDDGTNQYGGEVLVMQASDLSLVDTIIIQHSNRAVAEQHGPGVPNYLGAVAISPAGDFGWLPSKQDNILSGDLRGNEGMRFDQTVRAVTSKIDLGSATELVTDRVDHDNASVAGSSVFDPYGVTLFTALEGNRQVALIDVATANEIGRIETARAPQGMAVSADGKRLYVHNFMSRSITVFDIESVVSAGSNTAPELATVSVVSNEMLTATVLLGKQLFYDARDDRLASLDYMSCASCHVDGEHDGRVWDFTGLGEGLRNTITLKGRAGMGHGMLHWSSNFDELQDFEGQIREFAGGTGLMDDADFASTAPPLGNPKAGLSQDLDALAAYMTSLEQVDDSPWRNNDGSMTADALAGEQVFAAKGCATCHVGTIFTDSNDALLHDIGSLMPESGNRLGGPLAGIDTPTLLGVWRTAPYLHDGSAATLEEALTAHTSLTLSAAELASLVAYLSQLDDR